MGANTRYIIIKRLQIQSANALSAYWLVNGPPVTAAVAYAHALARKLDLVEELDGVALIHHSHEFQGDRDGFKVAPHQRRASSYIDMNDYASKKNVSLSLQPTAVRHLTVSLVIKFNDDPDFCEEGVLDFIEASRFSGGQVIAHNRPKIVGENELKKEIPNGFFVCDRTDLVEADGGDPTEAIVAMLAPGSDYYKNKARIISENIRQVNEELGRKFLDSQYDKNKKYRSDLVASVDQLLERKDVTIPDYLLNVLQLFSEKHKWLSATTLGYSAVTEFASRPGARLNRLHAYAEPLVGLVAYQSTNSSEPKQCFWTERWLDSGTYTLIQS